MKRGDLAAVVATIVLTAGLLLAPLCAAAGAVTPVIASGAGHTMIVRSDGTLWASGDNTSGQLGLGDAAPRNAFTRVGSDTDWLTVACGSAHTLAIKQNGTLWAWGFNSMGQLGAGDTLNRNTPVQIGTATNWTLVSAGWLHSAAVNAAGELWAWGWNADGELGDSTNVNKPAPVRVGADTDWAGVKCGWFHTLGWRLTGELWAWGANNAGQLGDNTTTASNVPIVVDSSSDWTAPVAGFHFTASVKANGRLWAWGANDDGQLGLGDTAGRLRPTAVGTATDWNALAVGRSHAVALKQNGTLWTWGYNDSGQLGNGGTGTSTSTPAQLGTATDWLLASAGYWTSYAAGSNAILTVWGQNTDGQLGLGTTTNVNVPTATTFKIDVTGPSARAQKNVTVKYGKKAKLGYSLADEFCTSCTLVKIRITKGSKTVKTFNLGTKACGIQFTKSFTCRLKRGTYKWKVFATDTAGNVQSLQNTKKLIVK